VTPFKILSAISRVEIVAVGHRIHELRRPRRTYGKARWRKLKGLATVRVEDGTIWLAEIHWYEAHGIGKKEFKIKDKIRQS
jgi:hypothetical protein